jgi:hypothetical protein
VKGVQTASASLLSAARALDTAGGRKNGGHVHVTRESLDAFGDANEACALAGDVDTAAAIAAARKLSRGGRRGPGTHVRVTLDSWVRFCDAVAVLERLELVERLDPTTARTAIASAPIEGEPGVARFTFVQASFEGDASDVKRVLGAAIDAIHAPPAFFPCGCSRLKVEAGKCDSYGPDGQPRPEPSFIDGRTI